MKKGMMTMEYNPDKEPIIIDFTGKSAEHFADMELGEETEVTMKVRKKAYDVSVTSEGAKRTRCSVLVVSIDGEKLDQSKELDKVLKTKLGEMKQEGKY